jgi:hypothetical protein
MDGMLTDNGKKSFSRFTGLLIVFVNLLSGLNAVAVKSYAIIKSSGADLSRALAEDLTLPDIGVYWLLLVIGLYGLNKAMEPLVKLFSQLKGKVQPEAKQA